MTAAPARWYREPFVWLLVALPLSSVVATGMLFRAGAAGPPVDATPDDVTRSAQVQQADLAADHRALALGLSAPARLHREGAGAVALLIDAAALPPGELTLQLVHPLAAARARAVALRRAGDARVADAFDPAVAWRLRLVPASGEWRLVARWQPGSEAVVFVPALGAVPAAPDPGPAR